MGAISRKKIISSFMEAWNAHDIDGIMKYMDEDSAFMEAAGMEVGGKVHVGKAKVRQGFSAVLERFPDAQWQLGEILVQGPRAYVEWMFTASVSNNRRIQVNGIDILHFRGAKIKLKDSYIKNRPPVAA
ncbi:nuclear transport factor 2 family protein [Sediminicola luteus]|uniref:SnoaL-like domain-containing protein n=1 Tax=Sediminicola luteus TaxID=319238 RepID=A0A2A4GE04_9FLAO|nr:nuclear transport factor 2 family protein [Sediminicola luteus]PCE66025.1 hypothetical protein B7P33_01615 [Sediminicola luteus]